MKNNYKKIEKEMPRRKFLESIGVLTLASIIGCKKKHHDPSYTPRDPPLGHSSGNPNNPGLQEDFHNYSGSLKDVDARPANGNINLTQLDSFGNPTGLFFSDSTDSNGLYAINDVPNGEYAFNVSSLNDYFGYEKTVKLVSTAGNVIDDILLIGKEPISTSTAYRNSLNQPSILEMVKYISENLRTDHIQKVRRFHGKIKVFLDRNKAPTGYLNSVNDALRQWDQNGTLFEETTIEREANIEMSYERAIGGKGLIHIVNLHSTNGVNIPEKIRIRLKDDLSLDNARIVTAREAGYSLFGAGRYSKDTSHAMFKDPNYLNTGDQLGGTFVSDDERKALKIYYSLPIGMSLMPYRD